MANEITTDNINTKAQEVTSIGDGDYVYIFKTGASGFSRIEKGLLFQGIGGSGGGGISADVYDAIKANVDALYAFCAALAGENGLAALALNGSKPTLQAKTDWPSGSGGDTPSTTPTINISVTTLSFSTTVGTSVQKTFVVTGSNLTSRIMFSYSQISKFSISPTEISASNANTSNVITVTYAPTAVGQNSATIAISSQGASNKTISLNGTATASGTTYYDVSLNPTSHITLNGGGADVVEEGGTWIGGLAFDDGYEIDTLSATMNGSPVSIISDWNYGETSNIWVEDVTGDIVITATAKEIETSQAVTYNKDNCTEVGFVNHSTGNVNSNYATWRTSNLLPIPSGAGYYSYYAEYCSTTRSTGLCFYNSSEEHIGSVPAQAGTGVTKHTFYGTIPSGAKYIKFSYRTSSDSNGQALATVTLSPTDLEP